MTWIATMDKKWIDKQLTILSTRLGIFKPSPHEFYFEPTETIYARLETGDERELQIVVTAVAQHLNLSPIPFTTYEWGLKMKPDVAGQVRSTREIHHIEIPFFYVGKKYATGAIIAHEVTHAFLFSKGIGLRDTRENELFTDVATVCIGLGKLLLNGLIVAADENFGEQYTLGYLPADLVLYCFEKVREYRAIDTSIARRNLLTNIKRKIGGIQKVDDGQS